MNGRRCKNTAFCNIDSSPTLHECFQKLPDRSKQLPEASGKMPEESLNRPTPVQTFLSTMHFTGFRGKSELGVGSDFLPAGCREAAGRLPACCRQLLPASCCLLALAGPLVKKPTHLAWVRRFKVGLVPAGPSRRSHRRRQQRR